MADRGRRGRHRAEGWGRRAEGLSALALRVKGYRILARRFRCPAGEIDIVARRGATLAIVEVKARSSVDQAIEALSARQRDRLERAALSFLAIGVAGFVPQSNFSLRFDLMVVTPWRWPRHLPNAWQPVVSAAGLGVF